MFSKRGTWKVLNITNDQKNTNQNYSEITSCFKMTIIKKRRENKQLEGYGAKRTLRPCWWECTLVQPTWKNTMYGNSWKKLRKETNIILYVNYTTIKKLNCYMIQQFHIWVFIDKKQKSLSQKKVYALTYSLQHMYSSPDSETTWINWQMNE